MTLPFCESTPDDDEPVVDDGGFSLALETDLLADALAAVERREAEGKQRALDDSASIDLDELAAVESELAIEIELDDDDDDDIVASFTKGGNDAEIRLRAMDAEAERDALRQQVESQQDVKGAVSAQLKRLSNQASRATATTRNAQEAQRVAETRAKRLKDALDKQQGDIERLLKRRKKERSDDFGRGKSETIVVLAEGIDNLMLAMTHTESDPNQVFEGVRMVLKQFENNLRQLGVEAIHPEYGSEFDPEIHEAIGTEQTADLPEGRIALLLTQGYQMDGKLLRAARVSVATAPTEAKKTEDR